MSKLVLNIQPATYSDIRAMTDHELSRTRDGSSDIDPARSHLNEVLHGPESQQAALDALWDSGVKKPTAQAESPFIQIVIGASPDYFRPLAPGEAGTWDTKRTEAWKKKTMDWLQDQFGQDLIHASIHLDETTPHIHALVVPTYEKKPRKPGKRNLRKKETEEEFQSRLAAYEHAATIRTAGRASNELFSQQGSFAQIRRSCADALADLGIEYGEDYSQDKEGRPTPLTTRQWVKQQGVLIMEREESLTRLEQDLKEDKARFLKQANNWIRVQKQTLAEQREELDRLEQSLTEKEAELEKAKEATKVAQNEAKTLAERLVSLLDEASVLLARLKAPDLLRDAKKLVARVEASPVIKRAVKGARQSLSAKKPMPEPRALDDEGLSM